jgi:uridylate kinase
VQAHYKRVLLKLSGEALLGDRTFGIDPKYVRYLAEEVRSVHELGVETAIVIGGGNFLRGAAVAEQGIEEATAHYMGMLAMVINALALQSQLEAVGLETRVQTALTMSEVAEPYIRRRAIRHLEKGRIVVFAAGTGNPFFTSDTAAALRAAEIEAEVILMAKNKVDGVYDADPRVVPGAKKYAKLTYQEMLEKRLAVMDQTAAALAAERDIEILVFDVSERGSMRRAVLGERIGTLVHAGTAGPSGRVEGR